MKSNPMSSVGIKKMIHMGMMSRFHARSLPHQKNVCACSYSRQFCVTQKGLEREKHQETCCYMKTQLAKEKI